MARGGVQPFVAVQRDESRPATNGSSTKRLRIVGVFLFAAACATLTFEGAKKGMLARSQTFSLFESADNKEMISQLAQQEVTTRLAQQAAEHLPAEARLMAQSLASNSSIAIDCSRKDAYVLLQTSFASIAANTSTENATMYAKDSALAAASAAAKSKWLTAEAKYRDAQAAHVAAVSAADYARSKYSGYESATVAGQKEWDSLKPKYDEESNQIASEVPVIEELIVELSKSSASKKATAPSQLAAFRAKANQLSVPSHDKRMAAQVDVLRAVMLKADSEGAMAAALKVVQGLLDTMKGRKTEIAEAVAKMEKELSANKLSLKSWEEKVVDLSDAADKNKNTMNTQGLVKAQLAGAANVAKEQYEDYHAGFLDDVAKFERELRALSTIDAKLGEAVAACP